MSFVLHFIPGSPFGRAALIALEEKGAPYRLAPLAPGEHKREPYLTRHPFGRMPLLEHNGFELYETQAILRYLDRVLPEPSLTPADPRAAARMDQAMNINDWYLFQGVNNIIGFQRVIGPAVFGLTPDEAVIRAAVPQGRTTFCELSRLLADQPFFAGETLSLADILIAPQLDFLAVTPEWAILADGLPNLDAWLERMRARPSLAATTWEKVSSLAAA